MLHNFQIVQNRAAKEQKKTSFWSEGETIIMKALNEHKLCSGLGGFHVGMGNICNMEMEI